MTLIFDIPGQPQPKLRHRTGRGRTYTPKRTRQAEEDLAIQVTNELIDQGIWKTEMPTEKPISLSVIFNFSVSQSWSNKKRAELLGQPHTQKPDASNLIKLIEDALTGVLWADDKQIYHLSAEKRWATTGRTFIEVRM